MSLPPLAHARPETVEQAAALLARPGARALAGGQSLVPALAARLTPAPALLVDLAGLPGLDAIESLPGGGLRIGALVRQRAAERSPLVARRAPLLTAALALVGHPSTRNRGTVLGSLAHAEPAAEVPAVAVALDGIAEVAGPGGARRELPARELLAGPGRLRLAPGELLLALRLAGAAPGERQAWVEFAPRRYDLPLVGAAARVLAGGAARVTLAGVGPTPVDAVLSARSGDPGSGEGGEAGAPRGAGAGGDVGAAVERLVATLDPPGDARAPAALRRHLARTLTLRALREAGVDD